MDRGSETNLQRALRRLAAESSQWEASPKVEQALLAELARRRRKAVWTAWLRWTPAMAAACLAVGIWLGSRNQAQPAPGLQQQAYVEPPAAAPDAQPTAEPAVEPVAAAPEASSGAGRAVRPQVSEYQAITPWYFYAGLPAPATARVVRMDVNAATAAKFGVYTARNTAEAEILIGDDGLARAIRFLRPVSIGQAMRVSSRSE